jgi:surface polysaccharide O-acyltransferase-like enzyme
VITALQTPQQLLEPAPGRPATAFDCVSNGLEYSDCRKADCLALAETVAIVENPMIDQYLSRKIKILSLFAIVAVVYIHSNSSEPLMQMPGSVIAEDPNINSFVQFFIANGLTRFCIPLFFCISGFLFFRPGAGDGLNSFLAKIAKRLKTLVLPFLIWSFIGFFLTRLMLHIPFFEASVPFPKAAIDAATLWKFITKLHLTPISIHLWFLVHLFGFVLLGYPIFLLLRTRLVYPVFAVIFCFWVQGNLSYVGTDSLFFMLGGFFAVRGIDMNYRISRPWALLMLSTWVLLVAVKTALAYRWSMPYFHQLTVLLGLPCVWFCYDHFMPSKQWLTGRLEKMADHTFFIYAAHSPFVGMTIASLLSHFGKTPATSLASFVIVPPLFIAGLVLISALLRKACPACYGILTGGRGAETPPVRLQERAVA